MTLQEFMALPHRFRWGGQGGDDCTTFLATWISYRLGVDPAEDLRGTYRDGAGAHRILQKAGGIEAFIAGRLAPLGFTRTDTPEDGDIGVVKAPDAYSGDEVHVGAIRFGKHWLVLAPAGVACKKLDHIAAWRMPAGGDN